MIYLGVVYRQYKRHTVINFCKNVMILNQILTNGIFSKWRAKRRNWTLNPLTRDLAHLRSVSMVERPFFYYYIRLIALVKMSNECDVYGVKKQVCSQTPPPPSSKVTSKQANFSRCKQGMHSLISDKTPYKLNTQNTCTSVNLGTTV